jgi:hypothetical protein
MRVSDADRESAMTALGEHMSTGRLTVDEYGDRAARLSTAKTRADVLALFSDLPQPRPNLSGVEDKVFTPEPLRPAPVARSRAGLGLALIPLVPLSWVVAIVVVLATGYWAILLLPILLTVFGAVLLGRGVHRLGRRVAANFTEATGWVGPEYRDAMRAYRDTMRGMRHRGGYNYRHHHHQHHHGRRRGW